MMVPKTPAKTPVTIASIEPRSPSTRFLTALYSLTGRRSTYTGRLGPPCANNSWPVIRLQFLKADTFVGSGEFFCSQGLIILAFSPCHAEEFHTVLAHGPGQFRGIAPASISQELAKALRANTPQPRFSANL